MPNVNNFQAQGIAQGSQASPTQSAGQIQQGILPSTGMQALQGQSIQPQGIQPQMSGLFGGLQNAGNGGMSGLYSGAANNYLQQQALMNANNANSYAGLVNTNPQTTQPTNNDNFQAILASTFGQAYSPSSAAALTPQQQLLVLSGNMSLGQALQANGVGGD